MRGCSPAAAAQANCGVWRAGWWLSSRGHVATPTPVADPAQQAMPMPPTAWPIASMTQSTMQRDITHSPLSQPFLSPLRHLFLICASRSHKMASAPSSSSPTPTPPTPPTPSSTPSTLSTDRQTGSEAATTLSFRPREWTTMSQLLERD